MCSTVNFIPLCHAVLQRLRVAKRLQEIALGRSYVPNDEYTPFVAKFSTLGGWVGMARVALAPGRSYVPSEYSSYQKFPICVCVEGVEEIAGSLE